MNHIYALLIKVCVCVCCFLVGSKIEFIPASRMIDAVQENQLLVSFVLVFIAGSKVWQISPLLSQYHWRETNEYCTK